MAPAREKKKRKAEEGEEATIINPEAEERKRLKKLTQTNKILSQTPAKGFTPLTPSRTVIKHHGTDILKKSQRKNRYLFSFPGHLASLSGGKIGELTDLASKNPILYLDFPQGRMKLCGTIVYPKNRYLTLQFSKGGKNVVCEDCFDAMIVFSDACWLGKKENNPDEARLDFPEELYEVKNSEINFEGGAGVTASKSKVTKAIIEKVVEEETPPESLVDEIESVSPVRQTSLKNTITNTPVRQSARSTRKKYNFAEDSSGEENEDPDKDCDSRDEDPGIPDSEVPNLSSEEIQQLTGAVSKEASLSTSFSCSTTKEASRGSLVQATISTLFKKKEEKDIAGGAKKTAKAFNQKMQHDTPKLNNKNVKISKDMLVEDEITAEKISAPRKPGGRSSKKKQKALPDEVEDDDDDDFTCPSEETNSSDDDWRT